MSKNWTPPSDAKESNNTWTPPSDSLESGELKKKRIHL